MVTAMEQQTFFCTSIQDAVAEAEKLRAKYPCSGFRIMPLQDGRVALILERQEAKEEEHG